MDDVKKVFRDARAAEDECCKKKLDRPEVIDLVDKNRMIDRCDRLMFLKANRCEEFAIA
jgi:hypothetical protein